MASRRVAERRDEAGIYLPFTAAILLALVTIVALAIDVGALYSRAADQQRAADLASLAGVQTLVETGSELEARDRVIAVLTAAGIDTDDPDIDITVRARTASELEVEVDDSSVNLSFGSLLIDRVGVSRTGVATLSNCGAGCDRDLTFLPPVGAIEAASEGDGWGPTLAGDDYIFALNHHTWRGSRSLICVQQSTRQVCPGYPVDTDTHTNDISALAYVPETHEIWLYRQTDERLGLQCWSVTDHASCGTVWLVDRPVMWTDNEKNVRGSHPVAIDGDVYLIDDTGVIHCIVAATQNRCGGYPRNTAFVGGNGVPDDVVEHNGGIFFAPDVLTIDERIFSTIIVQGGNTIVQCWDTDTDRPCAGWEQPAIATELGTQWWRYQDESYLHVHADAAGVPNGICVLDDDAMHCWDFARNRFVNAALEADVLPRYHGRSGIHIGTRSYFTAQWDHETRCWDWSTNSSCGSRRWTPAIDPAPFDKELPHPYDYAWTGECIIGLGDRAYFWSFDLDLEPCGAEGAETTLTPCRCSNGRANWGILRFDDADLAAIDGRPTLEIFDPMGNLVLGPIDLKAVGGLVDLDALPTWVAQATLRLDAELEPDQSVGATVRLTSRPTLID